MNDMQKKPVSHCDSASYLQQQSSEASTEDELIVPSGMLGDLTIEHCSCCKYAVVSVGELYS